MVACFFFFWLTSRKMADLIGQKFNSVPRTLRSWWSKCEIFGWTLELLNLTSSGHDAHGPRVPDAHGQILSWASTNAPTDDVIVGGYKSMSRCILLTYKTEEMPITGCRVTRHSCSHGAQQFLVTDRVLSFLVDPFGPLCTARTFFGDGPQTTWLRISSVWCYTLPAEGIDTHILSVARLCASTGPAVTQTAAGPGCPMAHASSILVAGS